MHGSGTRLPVVSLIGAHLRIQPCERTCHLDAGYDSTVTRQLLDELGFGGQIARKGIPAPSRQAPAGSSNEPTPG